MTHFKYLIAQIFLNREILKDDFLEFGNRLSILRVFIRADFQQLNLEKSILLIFKQPISL